MAEGLGSIGSEAGTTTVSGTVTANQGNAGSQSWLVDVTNTVATTVSGTVAVTQSGSWVVGVSGSVSVTGTVAATQSGTWAVELNTGGTFGTTTNPIYVAQATTNVTADANNSYNTTLGSGATFTGTPTAWGGLARVDLLINTNISGGELFVDLYNPGLTTVERTITCTPVDTGGVYYSFPREGDGYRIRFTNGTGTATLYIEALLSPTARSLKAEPLDNVLTTTQAVIPTKSVISGQDYNTLNFSNVNAVIENAITALGVAPILTDAFAGTSSSQFGRSSAGGFGALVATTPTAGPTVGQKTWTSGAAVQLSSSTTVPINGVLVAGLAQNAGAYVEIGPSGFSLGAGVQLQPGQVYPFTCALSTLYVIGSVSGDGVCWDVV